MKPFAERYAEDRRLVLLKLLEEAPGYTGNEYLLHTTLAQFGHAVSRDLVRTDLAWLAEQGLVSVDLGIPSLQVVTLTERGLDAANGRAAVPGVKRPAPGAG